MSDFFQVNPQLEVPIYQQLVDHIRAGIKTGALPAGTRLPTVRELADQMGLARGTIKRAYDELENEGMVKKVQGRGTFVSYQPESLASRKDRAMAAIDQMFEQMESLGFSVHEMHIFLQLKLQELAARQSNLKVAVVECNPEILSQLCDQLRGMDRLDLYAHILDEVLAYPYKIAEDMDLVITTQEHAEALEKMIPSGRKIAKIALSLRPDSMAQIVRLRAGEPVGILCASLRFGDLMTRVCGIFAPQAAVDRPCLLGGCAGYLAGKEAVLVPENWERYADGDTIQTLKEFSARGQVIPCAYQIDEGSLMYLREKIQKLRNKEEL